MSLKCLAIFLSLVYLVNAALVRRVTCPGGHAVSNKKCCDLFPVLEDIQKNLFDNGECGEDAHSALRIAFHDAIGYSKSKNAGGGADGSIFTFADQETAYPANGGIDDIVARQKPFIERHNLTAGDFIQFAAAVGVSNCPGAPRLEFLLGRPKATRPAEDLTVPEPFHNVATILDRFEDAGFGPSDVVALLTSHTIAAADNVDTTVPGAPFDSTPGVFDNQFFVETLLRGGSYPGTGQNKGEVPAPDALRGEMRLESDHYLARHPRTACYWQKNIESEDYMMSTFKTQMAKLAVLGQNTKEMVDCSDVIPMPKPRVGKAHLPAGTSLQDIEASCDETPFPTLTADPGNATPVKPVKAS
ncbi:manganese peroxidase 3 [Russula vinacea]|nr:manganese peroxidase 3 [Russula vinacea]